MRQWNIFSLRHGSPMAVRQAIQLDISLFFPIILGQLAQFAMSYYEDLGCMGCGHAGSKNSKRVISDVSRKQYQGDSSVGYGMLWLLMLFTSV